MGRTYNNITRKEIQAVIISKAVLLELSKILDENTDDKKGCDVGFKFVGKKEVIIRDRSTDFLEYYLPKKIKTIEMHPILIQKISK
jgi:hypothetical protein